MDIYWSFATAMFVLFDLKIAINSSYKFDAITKYISIYKA